MITVRTVITRWVTNFTAHRKLCAISSSVEFGVKYSCSLSTCIAGLMKGEVKGLGEVL